MFKKNLEAIREKNVKLAEQLEKLSITQVSENIEVYQAETGDVIISYEGLALDDIYDPIRVAKTTWNMNVTTPLKPYDIVVVYGLGLGYLFKRAFVSCDSRIVLYEPKIDILRYVLEYVDFSNEIASSRVLVTTEKEDCLNYLNEKYLSRDNLVFLYPSAYAQLLTDNMMAFTNDIVNVCEMKKMDVNTVQMLSKAWAKNSMHNMKFLNKIRPFSWLKNKYQGKTALIAAAGPSLADNIEKIKKYRDKFVIFAVNRCIDTLFNNDIKPDFVIFADTVSVKHTVDGYVDKLKETQVIADFRANAYVYDTFSDILTYFSENDLVARYFAEKNENAYKLTKTEGTAAAQAFYCAKGLGMDRIVFAGLDLAFKDKQIYANGTTVEIDENNQIFASQSKKLKKNVIKVKSVRGDEVLTRDDYALFIRQFEDIFSKENSCEIYNLSDFGAYIKGMSYSELSTIVDGLENSHITVKTDLEDFREVSSSKWADISKQFTTLLLAQKAEFEDIKYKASILLEKQRVYLQDLASNSQQDLTEEFTRLSTEFSELLPNIMDNPFLAQYFQSEFVNFLSFDPNKGVESIVKTLEFETKLLTELIEITEKWLIFIDKDFQ